MKESAVEPERLQLRIYPDPVLRERAAELEDLDDAVREVARRMFEIMYTEGGIGLAGPQVGLSWRIFVVNLSTEPRDPAAEMVFVNPEISAREGKETAEEGCLSLPGIRLEVERPARVRISALDLEGQRFEIDADELLARCVQHELDHLDGILITSRVPITARLGVRKALKELEKRFKEESGASS